MSNYQMQKKLHFYSLKLSNRSIRIQMILFVICCETFGEPWRQHTLIVFLLISSS